MHWRRIMWAAAGVAFSAGCAVGPDYQTPPPPSLTSLTPEPLEHPHGGGRGGQTFVRNFEIPKRWYELFHCKPLNVITVRAIDGNADLDAARAAVRVADANTEAARGSFFPQIGASLGSSAQQPSAAQAALSGTNTSPYSLSTGQISISFTPDVFGLTRRQVESQSAQAESQNFELEAAYLTLTSRIVLAAIQDASLRKQIESAQASVTVGREVLELLKKQLDMREASLTDVATQEAALAQFEQQLQTLSKQFGANRDLMIALTGHLAGEGLPEKFDFSCFQLPRDLPLSLPSKIVRNRPDIRAAEASMHAATADIGVAIANRLPQFNLTGNAGANATAIAKIASFSSPLLFWSLAGSVAATLFDGMTAYQKQKAAEAGLDRAAALYRSAVINAFQNIADVLQAIEADRRLLLAAERGEKAAQLNLEMTRKLLAGGQANVLQVLTAQQQYAQASSSTAQARAVRLSDTVLLFQALGGGWNNGPRSEG